VSYRFIELCCGSASMTLHLLGATSPLLPYQGSKWRFRAELTRLFERSGHVGPPDQVELYDPGPWGFAAPCVIAPDRRRLLIEHLEALAALDARTAYDALHKEPVPDEPALMAAQYLFLQRLSYSGKAVGILDGTWRSPGFNTSSAYGLAATERFGQVLPMVPSLIRTLRSYDRLILPTRLGGGREPAPPPDGPVPQPTVIYLDPPYAGVTAYPNGQLGRADVVQLALTWREAGAAVFVSEAEALPELVELGWAGELLTKGRGDTSRFRGKQEEWVTWALPR
jgi:hypothetical protein